MPHTEEVNTWLKHQSCYSPADHSILLRSYHVLMTSVHYQRMDTWQNEIYLLKILFSLCTKNLLREVCHPRCLLALMRSTLKLLAQHFQILLASSGSCFCLFESHFLVIREAVCCDTFESFCSWNFIYIDMQCPLVAVVVLAAAKKECTTAMPQSLESRT